MQKYDLANLANFNPFTGVNRGPGVRIFRQEYITINKNMTLLEKKLRWEKISRRIKNFKRNFAPKKKKTGKKFCATEIEMFSGRCHILVYNYTFLLPWRFFLRELLIFLTTVAKGEAESCF